MSTVQDYNERELLKRIAEGDELAFGQLFYAWKGKLYGFLFNLTRSEAKSEDVVQDVFFKVWQNRDKLREIDNFSSYLLRMAQNHAIDQLRKLSRESTFIAALGEQELQTKSPEDALLKKEIQKVIETALELLPPRQREVFKLHQQQGLKHEEIANLLGLSVSTVQNHMFRALENIRKYFNAHFPDASNYLMLLMVGYFYF
ncbi:RNA polymerase sigma factor [Pinibacter aurantiacus]|uniref:RNA polymerase sigma-70 factor n=1 Tax=Pinibacter aurantiacus TaxID=2851599 RepID=A0A9E2W4C1_9BACT|nr:RNA polymerase sigma-70 factor [Pinibacter aurantiacus]MBV4357303.1 RNA polymerase sigma-70 factor [Pinibacter aurantiacus]